MNNVVAEGEGRWHGQGRLGDRDGRGTEKRGGVVGEDWGTVVGEDRGSLDGDGRGGHEALGDEGSRSEEWCVGNRGGQGLSNSNGTRRKERRSNRRSDGLRGHKWRGEPGIESKPLVNIELGLEVGEPGGNSDRGWGSHESLGRSEKRRLDGDGCWGDQTSGGEGRRVLRGSDESGGLGCVGGLSVRRSGGHQLSGGGVVLSVGGVAGHGSGLVGADGGTESVLVSDVVCEEGKRFESDRFELLVQNLRTYRRGASDHRYLESHTNRPCFRKSLPSPGGRWHHHRGRRCRNRRSSCPSHPDFWTVG